MLKGLRHLMLLLVAFALVSGTTTGFARASQSVAPMAMDGMPCTMAKPAPVSETMPASMSGDAKPMTPCKGMTHDCVKQMGCVAVSALPARFVVHETAVRYGVVNYPIFSAKLAGLDHQPDPFPPRTA